MLIICLLVLSRSVWAALGLECSFSSTYPRQMVSYKVEPGDISVDGKMDEKAWEEVEWTKDFVDISSEETPRLKTRAKVRWDNEWLYIGAELEEKQIWANISHTCHCLDDENDQVIFHDNDFEIFVDVDGSNHNYKEFEMNALNQTWDLLLNKPYGDGGFENSSRVFGSAGFDMQPPLICGSFIEPENAINDPTVEGQYWTVEVALPIEKLLEGSLGEKVGPKDGNFWRINFSRVEWRVKVAGDHYVKDPAYPHEDNWVWSPQGQIAMHLPERWGFLQFSEASPGSTPPATNPEWVVRQIAMAVYYAEHNFADDHDGIFTEDVLELVEFLTWPEPDQGILLGECAGIPRIVLGPLQTSFTSTVVSLDGSLSATITEDRLLTILTILTTNQEVLPVISIV
eukprot:GFUD01045267.1.p1 GENE.GFUD01045267.1~~GFUD01045267.1.p1  ORF type:complete len:399 (+),score=134.63 GFUD01045267.1:53-1249(+)